MEWWSLSKKEVFASVQSSPEGLSSVEATRRLVRDGENTVNTIQKPRYYTFYFRHFHAVIPWLLLSLSILAFFSAYVFDVKTHYFDSFILFVILMFNSVLSSYQDYKSYQEAYKLDILHTPKAILLRDGKKVELSSTQVVVGDLLILEPGMRVPADARLIQSHHLEVDEALLTGESFPMLKDHAPIAQSQSLSDQQNMVFKDSYIRNGDGVAVVVSTGKNTISGKMADRCKSRKISPFRHEIDIAFNKIIFIAVLMIVIAVTVLSSQQTRWTEIVLMAVALLIGAIPESLPTIVMFAVANSANRLLSHSVLVKRNMLIETLGSIDVVCVDKTGTLTMNKLIVSHLFIGGRVTTYENMHRDVQSHFSHASLLANEALVTDKGFMGDPIDIALIDFFNTKGLDIISLQEKNKRLSITPFDTSTLLVSSKHSINGKAITYSKGAPEQVLKMCKYILINNKVVSLQKKYREQVDEKLREFSHMALRNVALSYSVGKKNVFIGIIGLMDTPKKDIDKTLQSLYDAHIEIKMITGDSKETSVALAHQCGFQNATAIDWVELRDLSVDEFAKAVEKYNVFTRMSAENKLQVVKVLQSNGHRVAITGDGLNDVPALQEAEVGIAIGAECADMTRDAADLIILDEDLDSVVTGIREGRTIFTNVRKVINYLLTANIGEIILVLFGSLFGIMPFLAVQLLWVNFVTNYGPALALGLDPAPPNIMKKKPTGSREKFINRNLTVLTVYISLKKILLLGGLFFWAYSTTGDLVFAQTIAFTWLVLWHFVRVATIKFEENSSIFNNKHLLVSIFLPIIAQLVILYTPIGQFFRVVPLSAMVWLVIIIALLAAVYLERGISLFVHKVAPVKDDEM